MKNITGDIVIDGESNARTVEWGMSEMDLRGDEILDVSSRRSLAVHNVSNTTAFIRPSYRQAISDISLATEELAARISGWKVLEDYSASDHQYITIKLH